MDKVTTEYEITKWKALCSGDMQALSFFYHHYYTNLYNYGIKLGGSVPLVEDCIQELFLNIWNRRDKLTQAQSVKSYLMVSFKRRVITALTQERKKKERDRRLSEEETTFQFSSEELIIGKENELQKERIIKYINALPLRQKEALYLRFYDNLSYEEIAEVMGQNYQSVVNLIYRAMKKLRNDPSLKNLLEASLTLFLYLCFA